jgi:hypothetical protein
MMVNRKEKTKGIAKFLTIVIKTTFCICIQRDSDTFMQVFTRNSSAFFAVYSASSAIYYSSTLQDHSNITTVLVFANAIPPLLYKKNH